MFNYDWARWNHSKANGFPIVKLLCYKSTNHLALIAAKKKIPKCLWKRNSCFVDCARVSWHVEFVCKSVKDFGNFDPFSHELNLEENKKSWATWFTIFNVSQNLLRSARCLFVQKFSPFSWDHEEFSGYLKLLVQSVELNNAKMQRDSKTLVWWDSEESWRDLNTLRIVSALATNTLVNNLSCGIISLVYCRNSSLQSCCDLQNRAIRCGRIEHKFGSYTSSRRVQETSKKNKKLAVGEKLVIQACSAVDLGLSTYVSCERRPK